MVVLDASPIVAAIRAARLRKAPRTELLQMTADRIRAAGAPYTSVYLYMLQGATLVLEAYSGRETHHTRIPVGTGVCGTAVLTGNDQNVGDVRAAENYLACNLQTRSELVVLIRKGGAVLGQIDIDSDVINPFNVEEEGAVRSIAQELGRAL